MEAEHDANLQVDRWISAWCSLAGRARRWQAALDDALRPHAMVAGELLVLWRAAHAQPPGLSQIDLSRELSISAAQVCGIVQALQNRGWMIAVRPPHDRRRLFCSLTPQGQARLDTLLADLQPLAQRCLQDDTSCLSTPHQATRRAAA